MPCNNENCCKHKYCIKNGHDVVSVMGHGFGSMCNKCGDIDLPLPSFEEVSLLSKLTDIYKKDK